MKFLLVHLSAISQVTPVQMEMGIMTHSPRSC